MPAARVTHHRYFPTVGFWAHTGGMTRPTIVETDERSRVVLPGHPSQRYVVRENDDGSLLLQPARVVTEAQLEYDSDPELRELLSRAAASPTVRRARRPRA